MAAARRAEAADEPTLIISNARSLRSVGMERLSREAMEQLRRSAAMGGLPRDACEQLLGEVARLRAQVQAVDGDLQKVEAILRRARARIRS